MAVPQTRNSPSQISKFQDHSLQVPQTKSRRSHHLPRAPPIGTNPPTRRLWPLCCSGARIPLSRKHGKPDWKPRIGRAPCRTAPAASCRRMAPKGPCSPHHEAAPPMQRAGPRAVEPPNAGFRACHPREAPRKSAREPQHQHARTLRACERAVGGCSAPRHAFVLPKLGLWLSSALRGA